MPCVRRIGADWRASCRIAWCLGLLAAAPCTAQVSEFALRFYGTGIGPPGQQDRVRIPIDDNLPAPQPDASAPCDLGAGGFSIDFWLRGNLTDNKTANSGGDTECACFNWIEGNIIIDRDIFGASSRDWGVSIAGGFVRFGTGRADINPLDSEHTLEGNTPVLDGQWHHVALVRDAATGVKRIYVDGLLDFASPPGRSRDDISYPDNGDPSPATPWGPYIVLAAEKHDAGAAYPSFNGFLDEVRFWNRALTQREILDWHDRVIPSGTPGLVGMYRFEEGAGATAADSSAAGSPPGMVIAGVPGNGEWVGRAANPLNTAPLSNGALPAGFSRALFAAPLDEPTVMEWTPDGRLFIAQRNGVIRVVQGGTLLPAPLISIPVDVAGGERGLAGLALDPDFPANGYFYTYHTTPEPRNRVSRWTAVGNIALPSSESPVWQNPEIAADYHHGGCIAFGPDGNLYIATGDQFDSSSAQNLDRQHGKILRLRADGSIPPDNPYAAGPAVRRPIWASGLRNPFRFAFDPPTGRMLIGNVGGNSDGSWEELNLGASGANYGWPGQEGPQCFIPDCGAFVFPLWSYQHNDPRYYVNLIQGSITTGPVYRGTMFPPPYRACQYVGDYANRWIRRLVFDASGAVAGDPLFLRAPEAGTIVDLKTGPDGALYYVNIGVPWSGDPDMGAVYRVAYTGAGNQPPVAVAAAAPAQGDEPLLVQFSSAGSADPDSGPQPLAYAWTFGDGGASVLPNPSHIYAARGRFVARLTVSDGAAEATSPPITITVGNPPDAAILSPPPGTTYRAGDTIAFSGSAFDQEDGPIPAGALGWRVILRHEDHVHPFLGPLTGIDSGSFTIPDTGHAPGDTFYEIELTAQDSDGLRSVVARAIHPVLVELELDTAPSGIPIFVDGEPLTTPRTFETLVGFRHQIEAQPSFVLGGSAYAFNCWEGGGPRVRLFTVPESNTAMRARYLAGGETSITLAVPANNRNADHYSAAGTAYGNFYDPLALCFGRDGGGFYQLGAAFPLPVPPGAAIVSARLRFVATNDQTGAPSGVIRGYDAADVAPFALGPAPLTAHAPLTDASVAWNPGAFAPGSTQFSPELAPIVGEITARPDWTPGSFIGFVIDGAGSVADSWRCVRNFASGQPPELLITVALPGPAPFDGDANEDGRVDLGDIAAIINLWGQPVSPAGSAPDLDGSGAVGLGDISRVISHWGRVCK